jgi:hypothetical protein
MALQLIDAAPGDFRNAQFMAKACELAYLPEDQGKEAYQSELGLTAKLISVDNTQAYVGSNDKAIVVAFRGWITGHSLGGALALMSAWRFRKNFVEVHQVYTFGAPMIGNAAAADAYKAAFPDRIFRLVDDRDFVPKLPTMSLIANEYAHCLTEVPLAMTGSAVQTAVQALQGFAGDAVQGVLNADIGDRIWARMQQTMDAHLMPNYQTLVCEKCPKE